MFWAAYPNKQGKAEAWRHWKRWGLDAIAERIMAALAWEKTHNLEWRRERGQFVPHGSTWVHQRRWEDLADKQAGGGGETGNNAAAPFPVRKVGE